MCRWIVMEYVLKEGVEMMHALARMVNSRAEDAIPRINRSDVIVRIWKRRLDV
jgi:hypothetical protein